MYLMKSFNTFIKDADDLNEGSFQSLLKTGSVLTAAFFVIEILQSYLGTCF